MKKVCLFVLVVALSIRLVSGQQAMEGGVSMPAYPGGIKALKEFITTNTHYPEVAENTGISGTVLVGYVINKKGKVEQVKIVRGISTECDAEAIRVTQLLPDWKPAMNVRTPVGTIVRMPIEFRSTNQVQPQTEMQPVVSGRITDKTNGLPIEGAFVILKGTSIGTITNSEGYYELNAQNENNSLEIMSMGYVSMVEPVGKNRSINVELDQQYFVIDFNSAEN